MSEDKMSKEQARLKCPKCNGATTVEIPLSSCLAMFVCSECKSLIKPPEESKNCCVVCEYSDKKCPHPNER